MSISGMTCRLELFVNDIAVSKDFYSRVLKFTAGEQHAGGYTPMKHGSVSLGLNLRSNLPEDHPVQTTANERPGRGVEIVLEVDDIDAMYALVRSQAWPVSSELQQQPWGLRDFRIVDPDGYYLRLTSREKT
jgi:predicted enzyme related to lactoylglutathione lyase